MATVASIPFSHFEPFIDRKKTAVNNLSTGVRLSQYIRICMNKNTHLSINYVDTKVNITKRTTSYFLN